ncbi:MAG TPA: VOC family protein [Azospirillaceae bacterium]|nr:VOC family protein [Azospirillaceae bacterium]
MDQRISLITLGVEDLPRARAFYGRLGWRESSAGNGNIAFFQAGGMALALYPLQHWVKELGEHAAEARPGSAMLALNLPSREAVDAALAEAVAAGGRLLRPAAEQFWGGYSGLFADPDGHYWEIAWNPFFALDEAGNLTLPA